MENIKLNNGVEMPLLEFGTMRVKNLDEVIPAAIHAAIV